MKEWKSILLSDEEFNMMLDLEKNGINVERKLKAEIRRLYAEKYSYQMFSESELDEVEGK